MSSFTYNCVSHQFHRLPCVITDIDYCVSLHIQTFACHELTQLVYVITYIHCLCHHLHWLRCVIMYYIVFCMCHHLQLHWLIYVIIYMDFFFVCYHFHILPCVITDTDFVSSLFWDWSTSLRVASLFTRLQLPRYPAYVFQLPTSIAISAFTLLVSLFLRSINHMERAFLLFLFFFLFIFCLHGLVTSMTSTTRSFRHAYMHAKGM